MMLKFIMRAVLTLITSFLTPSFTYASGVFVPTPEMDYGPFTAICSFKTKAPLQQVVQACTSFIHSKEYYFSAWPYVDRAIAEMNLGQYDVALTDAQNAITVAGGEYVHDPARSHAFGLKAALLVITNGSLEEALEDCNKALDRAPNDLAAIDTRGFVEYRLGSYAAAIADFDAVDKASQLRPSSLEVRGMAKIKSGDKAGGDADIAAAAQKAAEPGDHRYAGFGLTIAR
jgi:tetratricopeptide (TPR) repeat protein